MNKPTPKDLDFIKNKFHKQRTNWVKIGMSTCGIAAGAEEVYKIFLEEKEKRKLDISIEKCGCIGMCYAEPLVEVCVDKMPQVVYGKVDKETALAIIDKHICGKRLLNDHLYGVKE